MVFIFIELFSAIKDIHGLIREITEVQIIKEHSINLELRNYRT